MRKWYDRLAVCEVGGKRSHGVAVKCVPYLRDIIAHEITSPSHLRRFRAGKNNFRQGPRETGKFTGRVCAKPGLAGAGSAR